MAAIISPSLSHHASARPSRDRHMKARPFRRASAFLATLLAAFLAAAVSACRPSPVAPRPSPFFFIQMSDPQFGMFTANGDFSRETDNFTRAIEAANRLRPAFVVVTGDLTNRQGDSAQIAEYRRIASTLDPSIPLYNVPGNHDLALPLSSRSVAAYRAIYGPDYYTFQRNGVLGVVINSSLFKEPNLAPDETAAQERWLDKTIGEAPRHRVSASSLVPHRRWRAGSVLQPARRQTP